MSAAAPASVTPVEDLPRHLQLIVTVFGLYARRRGVVAVAELISLLGDLGADRSSMVRSHPS